MSFYKGPITGTTDNTGATLIPIGPVSRSEHFLGYVVAQAADGGAATYLLQELGGKAPLGGYIGSLAVIGTVYLGPGEEAQLTVSNGPPNTAITGYLIGDRNLNPALLAPPPAPTPGGSTQGGQQFQSAFQRKVGLGATGLVAPVAGKTILVYGVLVSVDTAVAGSFVLVSSSVSGQIVAQVTAAVLHSVAWQTPGIPLPIGEGLSLSIILAGGSAGCTAVYTQQ